MPADVERKKQELINQIEEDGLIGPWSWSDYLAHVSTILAYGVVADTKPENYEIVLNDILEYIRTQALYIALRPVEER